MKQAKKARPTQPVNDRENPEPIEGSTKAAAEAGSQAEGKEEIPQSEPSVETVAAIALSMDEYNALNRQIEQARQQAQDYFEGWQRERADFSNYKKRVERDNAALESVLRGQIIKKYLVILDDLERALKNRPTSEEGAAWAAGIELIYRKLVQSLEGEGITPITQNGSFDPSLHEAISHEDNPNYKSGEVIEVVQQGYWIGDRVLRPALVRVAR